MKPADQVPFDFDDQEAVVALSCRCFASAAEKAAAENDALGIPTPVGVDGTIVYVQRPPDDADVRSGTGELRESDTGRSATKWMWIVAGPNGAGKTTFTREFVGRVRSPELLSLNADERTLVLRQRFPETALDEVNLMAVQHIDAEVAACIQSGLTFVIETVLSSEKYRDDLLEARSRGYRIGLVYVSLHPPELSPARVQVRVQKGGHAVAFETAVRRYYRSHEQAVWFADRSDCIIAFDNASVERRPILVATRLRGGPLIHHCPGVNPSLDAVIARIEEHVLS